MRARLVNGTPFAVPPLPPAELSPSEGGVLSPHCKIALRARNAEQGASAVLCECKSMRDARESFSKTLSARWTILECARHDATFG